jgi:thiazole/oxazole-forming peptide maturase SagD family component
VIAYYHFARFRGGELALPRRSSSGVASGCELEDAVLQGLLEVVEHDAWFSAQITGAACPTIALESIDDSTSVGIVPSMQRAGFDVQVRNLTNDLGIPVLEANFTNRRSYAQYLVSGWGSHLDPTIALRRALCEAVQCVCFGGHERDRRNVVQGASSILRVFNERGQRVERTGRPQDLREIENLADEAPSALRFLRRCVASIQSALPGSDVVFCDVTPVRGMGIHVTNTVVPGLTDAVDSFVHVTERLLQYRRIIEGDDAPVLTIEQLYLGERIH